MYQKKETYEAPRSEQIELAPWCRMLESGKYYYLITLPAVFAKGFTLTAR